MRHIVTSILCLLVTVAGGWAQPPCFRGPLEIRDSLAFHIVNDKGSAFKITLTWRDPEQNSMDRPMLARVFDPQGHLLVRHDDPGERITGEVPDHVAILDVPASGAGVYEVVVTAFKGSASIKTDPDLPWGVFGYPYLTGHPGQFAESFVFVPPGLSQLPILCEGTIEKLILIDEKGATKAELHDTNPSALVKVSEGGQVWKLSVDSKAEFRLNFGGRPIVLCPDAATAKAVHAGVDVLDDGTVCYHKFQSRIHELLKKYRALPPSAYVVQVPVLSRVASQWLASPSRNQLLLGPYGVYSALDVVLREQNLDASSPWFGTIHSWRTPAGPARSENPWATYDRLGLIQVAQPVSVLGAVYSINDRFNPLFHNDALRNRIIIASLQELMMLRAHEMPETELPLFQGGERAFTFGYFTRTFPWVIRDCPEDVRAVWTEGLRRYVDRQAITQVASTVNQWTFFMKGIQHFADGTGDPIYRDLVQRHLRWMLTRNQWGLGQKPAGYLDEVMGPDATYTGISTHNLAYIYKQTKDKELLAALKRCIGLLNHTIAPEPDGSMLGATNFSHRTPGDWTNPQFGGGIGMLANELPEAAALVGKAWFALPNPRDPRALQACEKDLTGQLKYMERTAFSNADIGPTVIADGPEIPFAIWEHFADAPMSAALPAAESDNFTRNFGNEFLCVRRPGYYAFIYAGNTMDPANKEYRPQDPHRQHPRNGGGLSMFWSPAFGASILAKNWSAYAAQTIIAEHDGTADWEDYWSIKNVFDETAAEATITGTIRDQPIGFTRQYGFRDSLVVCDVTLVAQAPASYTAMWECFPYPPDKHGGMRITLLDAAGRAIAPAAGGPASAILFSSNSAQSHLVVFNQPRACQVGTDHSVDDYKQPHDYGRVLAELPAKWQAGQQVKMRWCILAIPSGSAAEAIQQALKAMKP